MDVPNYEIKAKIIEAALPAVPFDGWTDDVLAQAARTAGYEADMVPSVFPGGVGSALTFFSSWIDARMMTALSHVRANDMRVRDKIAHAVMTRLEILAPYKEAERLAIAYWVRPLRKWEGAKLVWHTADAIWRWAGDESTDYNHYTKRVLLSGVITSTLLFWLNDDSAEQAETKAFLLRRIENAMGLGKIAAKLKTA